MTPTVTATVGLLASSLLALAQTSAAPPPFEVASIKLNNDCGGRGRGMVGAPSPGRLNLDCTTLEDLVQMGYVIFEHAKPEMRRIRIEGGPPWTRTDHFSVSAKAEGAAGLTQMYGPMLRALLEQRFQLKLHRETREAPVYVLTVAKGGAKIKPAPEGSCVPVDLDHLPPPPAPGEPRINYCGNQSIRMSVKTVNLKGGALTVGELANGMLSNLFDRLIIDRTGLPGRYDFDLEFAPDSSMPMFQGMAARGGSAETGPAMASDPEGPSIFTALEKLGLKLEQAKGPVDVIVIDRVEKLTEN